MSDDPKHYGRRDFLSQCAALPLIAALATAVEQAKLKGDTFTAGLPDVPEKSGAETAQELESLLQLLDPAVRYRHVSIPEGTNAWPMLTRAGDLYVEPPSDEQFHTALRILLTTPTASDAESQQRIGDWIRQNQECRQHIDAGLAREGFELPRATAAPRLSLAIDEIGTLRRFAQLKEAVARLHLSRGELEAAIAEARSILALGSMLLRAECLFVDYLVGNAILAIGVESLSQAAMAAGAADDKAKSVISDLAAAETNSDHLKQAFRVELCRWFLPHLAQFPSTAEPKSLAAHFFAPDLFDTKPTKEERQDYQRAQERLATLLEGHPHPLNTKATALLCSQLHVHYFASLNTAWLRRDRSVFDELNRELEAWPAGVEPEMWSLISPDAGFDRKPPTQTQLKKAGRALRSVDNVLGKYMVQVQCSHMMTSPVIERSQTRIEAARLRIALRLYERNAGHLPSRLDGLVERGYLPDVPRDPFDRNQFRYSPERRIIWSVGQKGDNQGVVPESGASEFEESIALTWQIKKP